MTFKLEIVLEGQFIVVCCLVTLRVGPSPLDLASRCGLGGNLAFTALFCYCTSDQLLSQGGTLPIDDVQDTN